MDQDNKRSENLEEICEQYTHKYNTNRVAHNIITFHRANTRGSRIAHLCVLKNKCHPRVMSHLSLFASPPIFPPTSQTPTTLLEHDEHLGPFSRSHCDAVSRRQSPDMEGADVSYLQSQTHSEYDSAESIADSDLEDGELRKMLASPLEMQSR